MPNRHCESCGKPLTSTSARARFCGPTCRSRAHRAGLSAPAGQPPVDISTRRPAAAAEDDGAEHPMVTQVRERLSAVGRLETWEGQAALELATNIAASKVDTLSARATATEKLGAAMDRALKGVDAPASAVQKHRDQLAERRRARAEQTG